MTFIEGFEKGFTRQYERRQDRDQQLEDTQFQYGMQKLMKMREKRDEKKLEETTLSQQARDLATQAGNPSMAGTFYKELKNKIPIETLQKRISEEGYQDNPNFVAPVTTYKVPEGVEPSTVDYTEGMNLSPGVRKRMEQIDPSLLSGTDDNTSTDFDGNTDAFIYKPKNKIDVGSLPESQLKLNQAVQSGDPKAIAEAQEEIKAQKDAIIFRETTGAQAKADAEGTNPRKIFALVNPEGVVYDKMLGELRPTGPNGEVEMWNVSNPLGAQRVDLKGGGLREITPEQNKRWYDTSQNVSKKVEKYNQRVNKYAASAQTSYTIKGIVEETPEVLAEGATTLASLAQTVGKEVGTLIQMVDNQVKTTEASFDQGPDAVAKELVALDKAAAELNEAYKLAPPNEKIVLQKARYAALMKSAAFQLAAANGVEGRDLSVSELKSFEDQIKGSTKEEVYANLDQASKTVLSSIMSEEDGINKDSEAGFIADDMDVKSIDGLQPRRMGDVLKELNPNLLPDLNRLRAEIHGGATSAAATADPRLKPPVTGPDEFGMIPGQIYPGAGGKMFRYRGGGKNSKNFEEVK